MKKVMVSLGLAVVVLVAVTAQAQMPLRDVRW